MSYGPTFSIVIPSYNYGKFLKVTLDSLLQQGRSDCEIILIDDASTDDTPKIADAYRKQIRYIRLETNVGPSAAWAAGLRMAQGKYICKLDADDWQLPAYMDKMEKIFQKDNEIGVVIASAYIYSDGDKDAYPELVTNKDIILGSDEFRRKLLEWFFVRVPAVCVRREVFQGHEPPISDIFVGHDWEYFLRTFKGWKCQLLSEPIAVYRVHKTSVTRISLKDVRLLQGFLLWLDMASKENTPFYINKTERKTLALAMAKLYILMQTPSSGIKVIIGQIDKLMDAFQLVSKEGSVSRYSLMKFIVKSFIKRCIKKNKLSDTRIRIPIEDILPSNK